ncbi:MAG: epoxyqueuosine reductase QueH [Clostridia bacterium]
MERILLHICCGPCSLYCIDDLVKSFPGEITGYFANPNIHPYDEWMRRRGSSEAACAAKGIPLLTSGEYDFQRWANFESCRAGRCKMCYTVRAMLTARKAAELEYKYFTSTLFVSPYQNHEQMKEIFGQAGRSCGVEFLYCDFRSGFREGQRQARELGLYRQKYCGCIKSFYGESL